MEIENRLKNLKLIIFDLDGTLLSDNGTIGGDTKKLIRELHKKNVRFSFATGRLHSAITSIADELDIDTPLISLDGSLVKDSAGKNILYESALKRKHVLKAISYAEKYLLNIALCHGDAIYYTENNSAIQSITDKFGAQFNEIPSYNGYIDNTLEVLFASDNKEMIKYVLERMDIPFMFGINSSYFKSQRHGGIYCLQVRRKGSTKKTGIYHLLKYFKLKIYETAVVGDWYNDIELFQTDALKIALANAVPEIKRYADIELDKSNNEDGTGQFLEMVLKAK
jgi:Cof subfamily protein (haloacid dehalogenase superfamily)